MSLVRQRCFHHPIREAVARCPECERSYCRECVTEHAGRILCSDCLAKQTSQAGAGGVRILLRLRSIVFAVSGLLVVFLFFRGLANWLSHTPAFFQHLK